MEIEKLIERLQNWDGIKPDREIDCAIEGLKALQAENDRLKEEVQQMRWIPVEERKPKPSDNPILIYKSWDGRANFIGTAWYSSFHGWIPTNGTKIYGVTHWMPLPKPPKEDNL